MNDTATSRSHGLLKLSAVLWVVWGLVHVFAGVITLVKISAGEDAKAIHGITSRGDLATLQIDYPPAAMAILSQHGFNLAWFGVVTFLCAFWVWRGQRLAVYLAALVGGLAALGYFLYRQSPTANGRSVSPTTRSASAGMPNSGASPPPPARSAVPQRKEKTALPLSARRRRRSVGVGCMRPLYVSKVRAAGAELYISKAGQ